MPNTVHILMVYTTPKTVKLGMLHYSFTNITVDVAFIVTFFLFSNDLVVAVLDVLHGKDLVAHRGPWLELPVSAASIPRLLAIPKLDPLGNKSKVSVDIGMVKYVFFTRLSNSHPNQPNDWRVGDLKPNVSW